MNHFAEVDRVYALTAIDAESIDESWLSIADEEVISWAGGKDFQSHSTTEYIDIERGDQDQIILLHTPVISVTSVTDDAQDSSPTSITVSDLILYAEEGILKFKDPEDIVGNTLASHFTKGPRSVKVVYSYGFSSVPQLVKDGATYVVCRFAEIFKQEQEMTDIDLPKHGLTEFSHEGLRMRFDVRMEQIATKWDSYILRTKAHIQRRYLGVSETS